ncbi:MAG: M23 family metallopeptidase [Pseudomonadota bacterium]
MSAGISGVASSPSDFQQSVHAQHLRRAQAERRIIFAHGKSVQVLRIPPWLGLLVVFVLLCGAVAVIGSASYLFFRDELFTASIKRQHQIQVAYEDRVAELRREIDRITSRQLLNQQAFEARIERLIAEHQVLSTQSARLDVLLRQAGDLGLVPRTPPPSPIVPPTSTPEFGSALPFAPTNGTDPDANIITGSIEAPAYMQSALLDQALLTPGVVLNSIDENLQTRSQNQVIALAGLTTSTQSKADKIARHLRDLGIQVNLPPASARDDVGTADGIGGPLLPASPDHEKFNAFVDEASDALAALSAARSAVVHVPVANPAEGARISSRFGNRRDPFTRRQAFHAGIDFAAPTGYSVRAPANGVVKSARRAGGYGLMVELEHRHGLSTRYAHLSRMLVSPGQRVTAGQEIGRIGSTGRSTGPHLHYEVRRGNRAINPMPFVQAGTALRGL